MTDKSGFIRRWSRRKQAARSPMPESARVPDTTTDDGIPDGEAPTQAHQADIPQPAVDPQAPLDLPDIDTLTAESDFKAFMRASVPSELRNRALRKLWRLNPVFGHLDGLNDYDEDYTDAATVVKGLKSLYKVGRGIVEEPVAEPTQEAPPAESTDDIASQAPSEDGDVVSPDTDRHERPTSNKIS